MTWAPTWSQYPKRAPDPRWADNWEDDPAREHRVIYGYRRTEPNQPVPAPNKREQLSTL